MGKGVAVFFITLSACAICYWSGFNSGRSDTIRQLFSGEHDFKRYLDYRKTGGYHAELLQKLINCLRNDFGLVVEWDGLRKVWTLEVEHGEDSNRWRCI